MTMRMKPEEFPRKRRNDPKRAAERRVCDALQNLGLDGRVIYEFRYREGGKQVDYVLWMDFVGRFAIQVKGGTYTLDEDGEWYLQLPHEDDKSTKSPLQEAAQGAIEMWNAIRTATPYDHFVLRVLIFPDMARDQRMEEVAFNHECVNIIWGVGNLREDLERIARDVKVIKPPEPNHSDNEWDKVNRLQYQGNDDRPDEEGDAGGPVKGPEPEGGGEIQITTGSVTININGPEKLIVQIIQVDRDADGKPLLPED